MTNDLVVAALFGMEQIYGELIYTNIFAIWPERSFKTSGTFGVPLDAIEVIYRAHGVPDIKFSYNLTDKRDPAYRVEYLAYGKTWTSQFNIPLNEISKEYDRNLIKTALLNAFFRTKQHLDNVENYQLNKIARDFS